MTHKTLNLEKAVAQARKQKATVADSIETGSESKTQPAAFDSNPIKSFVIDRVKTIKKAAHNTFEKNLEKEQGKNLVETLSTPTQNNSVFAQKKKDAQLQMSAMIQDIIALYTPLFEKELRSSLEKDLQEKIQSIEKRKT